MDTGNLIVRSREELRDAILTVVRGVNAGLVTARDTYGIHATWATDETGAAILDIQATMVISVDAVDLTGTTETIGALTQTETRTNPSLVVTSVEVQGEGISNTTEENALPQETVTTVVSAAGTTTRTIGAGTQTETTNHPNQTTTTTNSGGDSASTVNTYQSTTTI